MPGSSRFALVAAALACSSIPGLAAGPAVAPAETCRQHAIDAVRNLRPAYRFLRAVRREDFDFLYYDLEVTMTKPVFHEVQASGVEWVNGTRMTTVTSHATTPWLVACLDGRSFVLRGNQDWPRVHDDLVRGMDITIESASAARAFVAVSQQLWGDMSGVAVVSGRDALAQIEASINWSLPPGESAIQLRRRWARKHAGALAEVVPRQAEPCQDDAWCVVDFVVWGGTLFRRSFVLRSDGTLIEVRRDALTQNAIPEPDYE